MAKSTLSFPDHNQNFWQLASIQGASMTIPGILIGGALMQQYGARVALSSIFIGNLLLWIIGLGVISMAVQGRKNIIQVTYEYLGRRTSFALALILAAAFIFWYMINIKVTAQIFGSFLFPQWSLKSIGVFLGVIVAVLSMGGIRLIKHLCVASFPFLFLAVLCAIITYGKFSLQGEWGIAFPAVIAVMIVYLPGIVNFSTFFRHSSSRADSILALTLLTLFDIISESATVFMNISSVDGFFNISAGSKFFSFGFYAFAFLSFMCLNLVNIYFASAGVEKILPRLSSSKRYLMIGLIGSIAYFCFQEMSLIYLMESLVSNWISNLGVVLIMVFLVKTVVKERPRIFEKMVACLCWITGCIVNVVVQLYGLENNISFLAGTWACLISFIFIIFINEIVFYLNLLVKRFACFLEE